MKENFKIRKQEYKTRIKIIFSIRLTLTKTKRLLVNFKKKLQLFKEKLSRSNSWMIKPSDNLSRKDKRMSSWFLIWRSSYSTLNMNFRRHKFWLRSKRTNLNSFNLSLRSLSQHHMLKELISSKITLKNPTRKLIKWSKSLKIWRENGTINWKRLVKEQIRFLIKQSEEVNLMS